MAKRRAPVEEAYNAWAAQYDSDGNPLTALDSEVMPEHLGDVRGLRVLDLGCGTGRHLVPLLERGARVLGLDASPGMLERARAKLGDRTGFELRLHDLAQPLPVSDGTIDLVISALVIEHVGDWGNLAGEIRRVLTPSGRAVISDMHPAMRLKGKQANFTDPISGDEILPPSVPRRIADYVNDALANGLDLVRLAEYEPSAELARRFPRAERYLGWPMLLVVELAPQSRTPRPRPPSSPQSQ